MPTTTQSTTLQESVNIVLSVLGEAPVNSLTGTTSSLALNIIEEVSTDIQSKGWWFNQQTNSAYDSTANVVIYPSNTGNSWHSSIPEEARRYITIRSARIAHARLIGTEENFKFTYQEELVSLAILQQAHVRNAGTELTFNSYPSELKGLGIDEFIFLSGNIEDKLGNLKLATTIKEQALLDKQATKLDEEIDLLQSQDLKVQEETDLLQQQFLTEEKETLKRQKEGELIDKQKDKIDEEVDLLQSQDLKVQEETDLLEQQFLTEVQETTKRQKEHEILEKQKAKIDEEVDLLQSQDLKVQEETDLLQSQDLKVQEETDLLQSQDLKVQAETEVIEVQKLKTLEETVLTSQQVAKTDAETELLKDTEAKTVAEKDVLVSQKNKLDDERTLSEAEKDYFLFSGVTINGAARTYKDYRAELRIMGYQETQFNGLPAYKKKEALTDAANLRSSTVSYSTAGQLFDSVNNVLELIGELPVTDCGDNLLATKAKKLLEKTDNELQARGWWFNTETDVEVNPTAQGWIIWLSDWINIEINDVPTTKQKHGINYYVRNLKTKEYNDWSGTQKATIIYKRELDEAPQKYIELLEVRVARLLTELYPQSGIDIQRLPKMEAELNAYFKDRENDQGNYSVFDNYDAAVRVGINRSYNLF